MSMPGWKNASAMTPCPICGGKDSFCKLSPDSAVMLCGHVQSGCMKHRDNSDVCAKGHMGWFHSVGQSNGRRSKPAADNHLTITEVRVILNRCENDLDEAKLKAAHESLGATIESLQAFGIGWDQHTRCYSFPMFNGKRQPIGVRLRSLDGATKLSVRGSYNGIFVPSNYETSICPPEFTLSDSMPLLLLLPEGPTDAAAAYDMGFRAVGRPSNMGGCDELRELLKDGGERMRQDVVIVADNDPIKWSKEGIPFVPGWEGALHLADHVIECCGSLRIIRSPGPAKDLRKWMNGGGEADMLAALAVGAEMLTRAKLNQKLGDMARWKTEQQKRRKQHASAAILPNGNGVDMACGPAAASSR